MIELKTSRQGYWKNIRLKHDLIFLKRERVYLKIFSLVIIVMLVLLSVMAFSKYRELSQITFVDGNGIGLYFLGFKINERVLTSEIPAYARGFLAVSIVSALAAVFTGVSILKSAFRRF